jgi:hypothetical protein
MRRRIRKRLRSEKGQSFVEFAIILPVALVIIFGVVDLGKATSYWLDSSHLANEAARSAAVNGCPTDPLPPTTPCDPSNPATDGYVGSFVTAIKDQAETKQLRNEASVCIWDLTGNSWVKGDEIHISVTSMYNFVPFLHLLPHTVTGRSTMRLETNWATTPSTNPYGIGPIPCPGSPTNPT